MKKYSPPPWSTAAAKYRIGFPGESAVLATADTIADARKHYRRIRKGYRKGSKAQAELRIWRTDNGQFVASE